jgi:hypothetical protein
MTKHSIPVEYQPTYGDVLNYWHANSHVQRTP